MRQATELIHAGERLDTGATPSLTMPIYETSTFVFDSVADVENTRKGKLNGYLYSRYENPTVVAVEQKLAAVDGAESSLLFSSRHGRDFDGAADAAQAAATKSCAAPQSTAARFHIIEDLLPAWHRRAVSSRSRSWPTRRAHRPKTRLVWFESPINPTLRCVDVRTVAAACKKAGVMSVIDNTFASAINQPVLSMGIDLSMQSARSI